MKSLISSWVFVGDTNKSLSQFLCIEIVLLYMECVHMTIPEIFISSNPNYSICALMTCVGICIAITVG